MEGRGITEFLSTGAAAGEGREVAVTLRKTPFHFVIRREWKLNYVGQPWPAFCQGYEESSEVFSV